MKAYRPPCIERQGSTEPAYLLPAHLFSLCSSADVNEGISAPQWYSQQYLKIQKGRDRQRRVVVVEGGGGGNRGQTRQKKTREVEQRGVHAVMLFPWTLTPLTEVPSVFQTPCWQHQLTPHPHPWLHWKIHIPRHIMRLCPIYLGWCQYFMS